MILDPFQTVLIYIPKNRCDRNAYFRQECCILKEIEDSGLLGEVASGDLKHQDRFVELCALIFKLDNPQRLDS